ATTAGGHSPRLGRVAGGPAGAPGPPGVSPRSPGPPGPCRSTATTRRKGSGAPGGRPPRTRGGTGRSGRPRSRTPSGPAPSGSRQAASARRRTAPGGLPVSRLGTLGSGFGQGVGPSGIYRLEAELVGQPQADVVTLRDLHLDQGEVLFLEVAQDLG